MRRLILAAGLAAGLVPAAGPLAARSDGRSPVVGAWAGARTVHEKGGCRLDDAAKARRTVTLTVRLAVNGSPIGALAFADAPGAEPQPWTGAVENGRVTFEAAQAMTCRGKTHQYVARPTGRMPPRAGAGATLRLTAEDGLCGCAFEVRYDLKWMGPAPAQP
jgi:hypothetical protein